MNRVAEFLVAGFRPIPWKSPRVFMKVTNDGRRYKTASRDKALETWQWYVRQVAREAVAGRPPVLGPLWARLDFTFKTKDTSLHGIVCSPKVVWNDDKGEWVKTGPGSRLPDPDNLAKGVLDALQGLVFGNDVQVCVLVSTRRHGPDDGVRVKVWEIGPGDAAYKHDESPPGDDAVRG